MALAPCRECGHEVSTAAPTCPACGAPRPSAESVDRRDRRVYVAGVAAVVAIGLGIFGYEVWDNHRYHQCLSSQVEDARNGIVSEGDCS